MRNFKVLDLGINYQALSSYEFRTDVVEDDFGLEQRRPLWRHPLGTFEIGDRTISSDSYEYLIKFFAELKGDAQPFLYKDWADYEFISTVFGNGGTSYVIFNGTRRVKYANITSCRFASGGEIYCEMDEQNGVLITEPVIGTFFVEGEKLKLVRAQQPDLRTVLRIATPAGDRAFDIGQITLREQRA